MKVAGIAHSRSSRLLACGVALAQAMFRGDAAHDGIYRAEGPRQFHRVKWKFPTGDRIVSSPVYKDGVIYFGGDDGNVYAVDAADGRQLWKHRTGGPVASTPAVAGGVVYVGSYDGKFYALDAKTGADTVEVRDRTASGDSRRRGCTACCRRTRRSPMRSTSSCRARSWREGRCISAAATATSTRSMRPPARSTGSSGRAMWCMPRPRTPTASSTSAAGTAISTRSTRGPAPKSGAFTAARIR